MKKSIYEITNEYQFIASQLEDGELTPELEHQLLISQNELQSKAICYGFVIKSIADDINCIDEEIKRLKSLKTSKEKAVERMKEAISTAMINFRIENVSSPTLKINFRKSESIEIINEDQISDEFKSSKVVESIDKTAIKKAIKEGKTVEGAILQVNNNLQIK